VTATLLSHERLATFRENFSREVNTMRTRPCTLFKRCSVTPLPTP
jgi:hypothetical protein